MCKQVGQGIYIAAIWMMENNKYLTDYKIIVYFCLMHILISSFFLRKQIVKQCTGRTAIKHLAVKKM